MNCNHCRPQKLLTETFYLSIKQKNPHYLTLIFYPQDTMQVVIEGRPYSCSIDELVEQLSMILDTQFNKTAFADSLYTIVDTLKEKSQLCGICCSEQIDLTLQNIANNNILLGNNNNTRMMENYH